MPTSILTLYTTSPRAFYARTQSEQIHLFQILGPQRGATAVRVVSLDEAAGGRLTYVGELYGCAFYELREADADAARQSVFASALKRLASLQRRPAA